MRTPSRPLVLTVSIVGTLLCLGACSSSAPSTPPATADGGAAASVGDDESSASDDDASTSEVVEAGAKVNDAGSDARRDASTVGTDASCAMSTWYADTDGDGFGDPKASTTACAKPSGYVADKTDCNDGDAAISPQAAELCDGVDNDCDGQVDAPGCSTLVGAYTGTYSFDTSEKVGSAVVNEMSCSGTATLTLATAVVDALTGTMTCHYAGSLSAFDHNQTASIRASVQPDGSIQGTLTQVFYSLEAAQHDFPITGQITGGTLTIAGTGSWLPNAMSAVAWGVTDSIAATKN